MAVKAASRADGARGFIDSLPYAVLVADADGKIIEINTVAEWWLDYDASELIGGSLEALLSGAYRAKGRELARRSCSETNRSEGVSEELVAVRKDGVELPVTIHCARWESPAGSRLVISIRDNEPRLRIEAEAAAERRAAIELDEFSRALIRESAVGIIAYEADSGACVLANDAATRITGCSQELLISQNFREIASWRGSGLLAGAEAAFAARRTEERYAEFVTTAGKAIAVSCEFLAIPLRGRLHLVLMMDDLTERRNLEQQVRAAQKMEAIGQLAGGVAHDFNNLLTVIGTYSSLLLDGMPDDDPRREDLSEIFSAAQRAAALTRQLLAFGRRQLLDAQDLDINDAVRRLEEILRRVIPADITFEVSPGADLGTVRADAGQLEQAIMNLVMNARDAMPSGGRLRIETENVSLVPNHAERADMHTNAAPDAPVPMVVLRVSDTGVGMSAEIRSHMFEPFFTTKGPSRGSGLGLSTTYGIVKQSGGFIRIQSEPGQGSTFELYFPRVDRASVGGGAAADAPFPDADHARGVESVLVAEDDEQVRRIIVSVLRERGYTVTEATDGAVALDLANAMDRPPDLLVTDIMMPNLGGRELAERLRARWPGLPVLFASAYATDTAAGAPIEGLPGPLLRKPFLPGELRAAVRGVLTSREN